MIVESYEDVIVLSGALRSNFWETLHTAISLMLKRHPSGVIIDCSGLTDATPEGAQTFRDVMEFIHNHDARVIVASVPQNVLDVLKSVPQVRSQLAIAESVEQARKSLDLLVETRPAKRRGVGPSETRIVLLLSSEGPDKQACTLAAQLAEARDAEIHLVCIVIVPRELPLTAPLSKEEAAASRAIELARGSFDRQMKVTPHLERGRDIASTLQDFLEETPAELVVLPMVLGPNQPEGPAKTIGSILQRVTQEVILVRGPVLGKS